MKTNGCYGLILAGGAAVLMTGCVEHRVTYVPVYPAQPVVQVPAPPPPPAPPPAVVVVPKPPPPPPPEVIRRPPGPAYVWAPGYYAWRGGWVWVKGSYVARPRPHAIWVPGQWAHRGGGYVWVGGYWR